MTQVAAEDDEILICDGNLVGKLASQVRVLHFHRDREFLHDQDSLKRSQERAELQPRRALRRAPAQPLADGAPIDGLAADN